MAGAALLQVDDVALRFGGITALGGVSLAIQEGETVAVIGPNGSGKTSLFNCITGLYKPTSGAITFRGKSLLGLSPDRVTAQGLARTFQNLRLFLHMTVLDNLMLGRHLHFRKNLFAAALRLRDEEVRHRERCEEIIDFLDPRSLARHPRGELRFRRAEARRARPRAGDRAQLAAARRAGVGAHRGRKRRGGLLDP